MPLKSEPCRKAAPRHPRAVPAAGTRVGRSDCLALKPLRCRQERPDRQPQEAVESSEPSTQGPRLCLQTLGSGSTDETPGSSAASARLRPPGPQSLRGARSHPAAFIPASRPGVRGWVPTAPHGDGPRQVFIPSPCFCRLGISTGALQALPPVLVGGGSKHPCLRAVLILSVSTTASVPVSPSLIKRTPLCNTGLCLTELRKTIQSKIQFFLRQKKKNLFRRWRVG